MAAKLKEIQPVLTTRCEHLVRKSEANVWKNTTGIYQSTR